MTWKLLEVCIVQSKKAIHQLCCWRETKQCLHESRTMVVDLNRLWKQEEKNCGFDRFARQHTTSKRPTTNNVEFRKQTPPLASTPVDEPRPALRFYCPCTSILISPAIHPQEIAAKCLSNTLYSNWCELETTFSCWVEMSWDILPKSSWK